jgi:hypothetical protein
MDAFSLVHADSSIISNVNNVNVADSSILSNVNNINNVNVADSSILSDADSSILSDADSSILSDVHFAHNGHPYKFSDVYSYKEMFTYKFDPNVVYAKYRDDISEYYDELDQVNESNIPRFLDRPRTPYHVDDSHTQRSLRGTRTGAISTFVPSEHQLNVQSKPIRLNSNTGALINYGPDMAIRLHISDAIT